MNNSSSETRRMSSEEKQEKSRTHGLGDVARPQISGSVRRSGFSLVELLVVIAIIAILMALLLPALKMAKDMVKRTVCAGNEHQISLALFSYAGDYNGFVPDRGDTGISTQYFKWKANEADNSLWQNLGRLWEGNYLNKYETYLCPARSVSPAWLLPGQDPNSSSNNNIMSGYSYFLPNDTVFYSTTLDKLATMTWKFDNTTYSKVPCNASIACYIYLDPSAGTWSSPEANPHANTGANILYIDGSVSWLSRGSRPWGGPSYDSNSPLYGNERFNHRFWARANMERK